MTLRDDETGLEITLGYGDDNFPHVLITTPEEIGPCTVVLNEQSLGLTSKSKPLAENDDGRLLKEGVDKTALVLSDPRPEWKSDYALCLTEHLDTGEECAPRLFKGGTWEECVQRITEKVRRKLFNGEEEVLDEDGYLELPDENKVWYIVDLAPENLEL